MMSPDRTFSSRDGVRVVHETLRLEAQRDPEKTAVRFLDDREYSRKWLWDASRRFGAGLRQHGISLGDRVGIVCSNRVELIVAYFGSALVGAVSVPLNPELKGSILEYMLETTSPRLLVGDTQYAANFAPALANAGVAASIVLVGEETDHAPASGCTGFDQFVSIAPLEESEVWAAQPEDVFCIMFTSGTTGRSKGIMFSHSMAMSFVDTADWMLEYVEDDVSFSTLPLFHANALYVTLLGSLRGRATAVFADRFSASKFWDQVRDSQATIASLLGSMVPILLNRPPASEERDHSLRRIIAIPSPRELSEFKERFGAEATELYGVSDCGLPIGVPPGAKRPPGSCGRAHPDWECRVFDDRDEEVPRGTVGELVLRPLRPYTMQLGYWNAEAATIAAWRNLWFHTGDLVVEDEDGWFFFMDRAKDSIRRFGENVSSFEVESVISSHGGIAQVAVYAVPSELSEDEVMAAVVPEPGVEVSPDELLRYCEERLPYFAVPRYIDIRKDLPMTETEKVRKASLRSEGATATSWDAGPRGRSKRG